jgi:hypothetical protein
MSINQQNYRHTTTWNLEHQNYTTSLQKVIRSSKSHSGLAEWVLSSLRCLSTGKFTLLLAVWMKLVSSIDQNHIANKSMVSFSPVQAHDLTLSHKAQEMVCSRTWTWYAHGTMVWRKADAWKHIATWQLPKGKAHRSVQSFFWIRSWRKSFLLSC